LNTLIGWGLSFTLFALGMQIPTEVKAPIVAEMPAAPMAPVRPWPDQKLEEIKAENKKPKIKFTHGDVSWLPELAAEAGWPAETHEKLAQIILRESGGCPNRLGGDAVDKNCNITHVTEWNHRSDTGLLQINGVNYNPKRNKWAIACRQMNICTQQPLLDPLTNLKVGYLLYQADGWNPWDPCAWGEEWAHRCKNKP
jgi:hypothetical protein